MSIISKICGYSTKRKKTKKKGIKGVTPELNTKVVNKAMQILKSKGIKNASKSQFDKAYNEAIKFYGYTPSYFKKVMSELGSGEEDYDF
jgi:Asp-tRNA(Asn)/Glu-tRNA(Gln) amidotransferase B subunit